MHIHKEKKWYKKWWGVLVIVLLASCVAFTLLFLATIGYFFVKINDQNKFLEQISQFKSADRALVETYDDPFIGNANAQFVIVEFSDFQCPFCREEYFVLQELMKEYGDRVKLIYRDFPVTTVHENALNASLAGNCAQEQSKFWAYHDRLFLNQNDLTPPALIQYAVEAGLNENQFTSCLNSRKYEPEVQQDLADGLKAGVEATPTFFVNGLKAEGTIPLDIWKKLIDDYLKTLE